MPRYDAKQHNRSTAMRPTWEGHLRLSLVTCPVALYTATERTADVHFNLINPKTNNRIRMQTVDAGTGDVGRSRRPGEGLRGRQEQVRAARQGRARRGEARIDAHHRHRGIRRCRRHRPHLLGRALLPRARRQDRHRGLRRDPGRDEEAGQGRAGPAGAASARAYLRARAARRRHPAHHLAQHDEIRSSAASSTATCPSPMRGMLDIAEKIIAQQQAEVRSHASSRTATRTRCAS